MHELKQPQLQLSARGLLEYMHRSPLWLPSFGCSPLSGRCGKVSAVRVFAGSPCQMAVVKIKNEKNKEKEEDSVVVEAVVVMVAVEGYLVAGIAGELVSQLVRL